jgi:hypothetical protein
VVTAHKEVLAIIYNRTGRGISKGPSPPAEKRLLLEQANPPASFGQCHSRREAGKTPTDNDDLI